MLCTSTEDGPLTSVLGKRITLISCGIIHKQVFLDVVHTQVREMLCLLCNDSQKVGCKPIYLLILYKKCVLIYYKVYVLKSHFNWYNHYKHLTTKSAVSCANLLTEVRILTKIWIAMHKHFTGMRVNVLAWLCSHRGNNS